MRRLVGAVLAEQHDEWQVGRRSMNQSALCKALLTIIDTTISDEEDDQPELRRVTATEPSGGGWHGGSPTPP